MTLVFEDKDLPGGDAPGAVAVNVTLWGAGQPITGRQVSTGKVITGTKNVSVDNTGYWELDLVPNADIAPDGTTYRIDQLVGCDRYITYINVPVTGGPFNVLTIEDDAMNTVAASALSVHASDITLHAGHELAVATIGAPGFTITGTGYTDITGLAITFTVPNQPYRVEFSIPMFIDDNTGIVTVKLTTPGTMLLFDVFRATQAGDQRRMNAWCRIPNSFHSPVPGTIVSYKLEGKVNTGGVEGSIIPDIFGDRSLPVIQAISQ